MLFRMRQVVSGENSAVPTAVLNVKERVRKREKKVGGFSSLDL